jgi:hydrogenase expression/formation protein HypE
MRDPRFVDDRITLACGAGGAAMRALIEQVFAFGGAGPGRGFGAVPGGIGLPEMDDGAAIPIGDRYLVITTDAHVVQPIVFPGGDIGRLAVCGTVNDLAMMGATEPLALSLAVILEDGFPRTELERIWASIRTACDEAGTTIVTGDTKVMRHGELDRIAITTTGVALTPRIVSDRGLGPGDLILVTGSIGDHGLAILATRRELALDTPLASDTAPINGLVRGALAAGGDRVVAMKDPTRGGLASALHEMAGKSGVGIVLDERRVPIRDEARAVGELLGIDPLMVANEGKAVIGVRPAAAEAVLEALRAHPLGRSAAIVGECIAERPGKVIVETGFGRRLLVEPEGELQPRIC